MGGSLNWNLPDRRWAFPQQPHYFVTDVHADADALLASLEATGGIERVGHSDEIRLTAAGRAAVFVMGGDYFDKGPSNLRLLRVLERLVRSGAEVVLLAGNHDVRQLMGIAFAERTEPRMAHLFVRTCPKSIPLLREVYEQYVAGREPIDDIDEAEIERRLLPDESWWDEFPPLVRDMVPPARLEKELRRIREKCCELRVAIDHIGMTMGMVYAALRKCRELFLEPDGEFFWLYQRMTVVHRAESFLFAHAGIDDVVAQVLRTSGVPAVNRWFRQLLAEDPFELYNGPLGNMFRTKYRAQDFPFTASGAEHLLRSGIYAIVHGHKTHVNGQQLEVRNGIVHFECDTSLDRNTRLKSGLSGIGRSAMIIDQDSIRAISNDSATERVLEATAA